MEGAHAALRAGGRRLLQDCTVLGSVGVGGSIAILLLIGFVAGAGATWLFFWLKERRQVRIELEYRNRFGDAVRAGLPDVTAMVRAATTPTIAAPPSMFREGGQPSGPALAKAASAMTEGPLGVGVGSFKHDPLRSSLKEHANPVASTAGASMARSSSGNPFSQVSSFNVMKNEVCSLNNSLEATPARTGGTGLIGTAVYGGPASDPASPRIVKQTSGTAAAAAAAAAAAPAPVAASNPISTNAPFAWPAMDASTAGTAHAAGAAPVAPAQAPQHARSATVVGPGAGPSGTAAPGAAGGVAAGQPAPSSVDYLAALDSAATNPFETPALRQQEQQREAAAAAAAKAAAKQELLRQVSGEEYGEEELDPEWATLLADLDTRLQAAGRPRLSSRERAVAIRSLIVATASQSAEAALGKALADVEAFRRAQSFRAAA